MKPYFYSCINLLLKDVFTHFALTGNTDWLKDPGNLLDIFIEVSCNRFCFVCLHTDNPPNKKPVEIEKPDLPAVQEVQPVERDPAEPPQIKGPVELPERKKEEEVQLDRPDAGKETEPGLES